MGFARSLQSSPVRQYADETIRAPHPISMQRGRSLQGIVESEESHHVVPSPTTTAPTFETSNFEVAEMPIPECFFSQAESTKSMPENAPNVSAHPSPASVASPYHSAYEQSSNEPLPFFDETGGDVPSLGGKPVPLLPTSKKAGSSSPNRPALSPRRMSISDLNLEPGINASIEETNVSLDDIAQYIEGPDPTDSKWICKFEDCNKRFGRKENIKSHVQTHLGDRQFRCDHCKKCFVRGHDLKRHAKIHTGTKPYPCLCGNAFARHDALTRHRQRGMCIGAFDGVVKKVIKRGRPRKHRPEMDERLDKATKTRKRANEQDRHYASSDTSGSMSSWGSPPTETMESLSIRGNSPFDDIALFGAPHSHMNVVETIGLPPDMFSFTPPASPGYSCGNQPSPSHRSLTPTDREDMHDLPPNAISFVASHMALQNSQNSLPSLSHSCSSPAADIVAFDFSEDPMNQVQRLAMKMEPERNDFDTFLDYGNMEINMDSGTVDNFFAI
jgi:regulatory protein SWI5